MNIETKFHIVDVGTAELNRLVGQLRKTKLQPAGQRLVDRVAAVAMTQADTVRLPLEVYSLLFTL